MHKTFKIYTEINGLLWLRKDRHTWRFSRCSNPNYWAKRKRPL